MRKFYLLSALAFSASTFAQTIITKAANDYVVGDVVNRIDLDGTPDNSATGAGVTFNNSALTTGTAITGIVSTPSATEIATFPGTNVKFSDGNGNDFFYKTSATNLQITGVTIEGGVLNFNVDNALFLQFPTAYGNTYTDNATGTATVNATTVLLKGTIATTADAWGTLLLGTQTIPDIIRIKTVQNYNLYLSFDVTYSNPIGSVTSTIYTYYNNANRYPVFTSSSATFLVPLAGINETVSSEVALSNVNLATANPSSKEKLQVYPNPVHDDLFVVGDLAGFETVKIYNTEGRMVKNEEIADGKVSMNALPAGNYLLQFSGKNKAAQSIKIIKK